MCGCYRNTQIKFLGEIENDLRHRESLLCTIQDQKHFFIKYESCFYWSNFLR